MPSMPPGRRVFSSSVGSKILIGATGLALFLYLVTHIAGNLLVFFGPRVFNQYAHMLTSNPLVPLIEIGLLLIFLTHVYKTVRMYLANQLARPVRYAKTAYAGHPSRKSIASSTMIASGLWLLVFVIVHVRSFKYGPVYHVNASNAYFATKTNDAAGVLWRDLYRLEMENFRRPVTVVFYVLSMIVVGSHLWHGVASGFQSLGIPVGPAGPSIPGSPGPPGSPGINDRRRAAVILLLSKSMAVLIAGGFIIIVLWAYFRGGRA